MEPQDIECPFAAGSTVSTVPLFCARSEVEVRVLRERQTCDRWSVVRDCRAEAGAKREQIVPPRDCAYTNCSSTRVPVLRIDAEPAET